MEQFFESWFHFCERGPFVGVSAPAVAHEGVGVVVDVAVPGDILQPLASLERVDDVVVVQLGVRALALGEDLPHDHAERPHVALRRADHEFHALQRRPTTRKRRLLVASVEGKGKCAHIR